MDKQAIIDLLNADIRDEHAAIIQYLQHAYAIGEGEEAGEIEAIAREEMRHLDWLAEQVVELGGKPDMARGHIDLTGSKAAEWMSHDVDAEERAIAQYQAQIEVIEDPAIERLLKRILADEKSHRGDFAHLSEKLAVETAEGAEAGEAPVSLPERTAEGTSPHIVDILQTGIRHEYTVILQYLYHDFMGPDCEIGREMEMQAINEMQHMGWLAEHLAQAGGHPDMEHTDLVLDGTLPEMLQADIEAERAVTKDYTQQIAQLQDKPLKELLTRIRDHEIYHDELFSDILDEVQKRAPTKFTVGSLMKKSKE
ncbi:MAG: ferritin-like domain-containing protein [Anaerolineae bacterium]|nr:ferritin-like domain-containing protein [Anaerolineae bacterium]